MKKLLTIKHSKSLLMMLFIGLMVCAGCKDEEENTYFHHKISESLYPLLFNEGSYWIYNNTDTTLFDTIVLTKVEIDTLVYGPSGPGQGSPGEEQVYVLSYTSSQFGAYQRTLREDYISRGWMVGGEPIGVEYLSSHQIGDELLSAKIADIYNSFVVNGESYADVVKMDVINYGGNFPGDMNIYYVDYVGIIKKVIAKTDNTTETWELLKYTIVPSSKVGWN